MPKQIKDLSRDQIIERLTAEDVYTILAAADEGDYTFLCDVIQGYNIIPYRNMTPTQLEEEYIERCDRIEELIEDGLMPYDVE